MAIDSVVVHFSLKDLTRIWKATKSKGKEGPDIVFFYQSNIHLPVCVSSLCVRVHVCVCRGL